MKKIAAVLAAVVMLGLVFAPPAQASKKNDNLYVKVIRAESPELRFVKRGTLIKTAKATCRYLRAGGGILDAVQIGRESGFSRDTALTLVAGAVVFYCPDQEGNY